MGRGSGKTFPPTRHMSSQTGLFFFFQTGLLKCTQHHWSSLIIRQMQINTTMSDHLIPSEWLLSNDRKWKIGKNVEKREFWYLLAENINPWIHYRTQEGGSLKTKHRTVIVKRKVKVAQSCVTPWTVACQALLSMEFSRQKYLSRLPCPPPGDLPNSGIKPRSPTLQVDSLQFVPSGKPRILKWIAYPFSWNLPNPGIELVYPALQVEPPYVLVILPWLYI